jgi:hypothetical protein
MSETYTDETGINITALHDAIQTYLRAAFPSTGIGAVPTIEHYTRPAKTFATPAIFFELTGIDPQSDGDDSGSEQFNASLSFSTYVCCSYRAESAKLVVRELVAKLIEEIWDNSWSLPVSGAEIITAQPDQFSVEPGGTGIGTSQAFEVWRIDWTQDVKLGASVWATDPETIPTNVFCGWDPKIGIDHVADYDQVIPEGSDPEE